MNCPYCEEDKDGYRQAFDKNAHVFICRNVGELVLRIRYYKEKLMVPINYCPMCGKELNKK